MQRISRVAELLRQEVARALRTVQDRDLRGLLTVTGVEVSKDLKVARVFYSVLGTDEDRALCQRALKRAEAPVRRELFARLRMKVIPRVAFEYDTTPEMAGRVERILKRIEDEKGGL